MVYICLAEAAVLAIAVVSFTGILRWQSRAHARSQEAILNKLLHAVGTPWQPAPADRHNGYDADEALRDLDHARRGWTTSPEQEP